MLLSDGLAGLADIDVTRLLAELEVERRRLDAVDHLIVNELTERSITGTYARGSAADLLVSLLRIGAGAARARVTQALDLAPRHALTGELLEPRLPRLAAAVRAGAISVAHVEVITKALDHIPGDIAHEATPVAEQLLVDTARHDEPGVVARTARQLLAHLDPDGVEPHEADLQRRRELSVHTRRDGSGRIVGTLTPECMAVWKTVLDALSAPAPAENGEADARSAGQRRHDGLHDAGRRLLSADLPDCGGVPVTLVVTMSAAQLADRSGYAVTGHDDLVAASGALRMADEAVVVGVALDARGGIVSYGRERRLASPGQRLALAARDRGCSFPGCTRPPPWCQAHHVRAWQDGGATDLANLTLVCGFHHREFERRGWLVRMRDGVPEWIPPRWLDREQRPRRNEARHVRDLLSRVPDVA